MKYRLTLSICLPLLLTACGDNDGPEDAELNPLPEPVYEFISGDMETEPSLAGTIKRGVYQFATVEDSEGSGSSPEEAQAGVALIGASGRIIYAKGSETGNTRIKMSEQGRFKAPVNISDKDGLYPTEDTVVGDDGETRQAGFVMKGQTEPAGTEASMLTGTVEQIEGQLVEIYSMTRENGISNREINLDSVAGTYKQSVNDAGVATTIQVTANGALSGSDNTGCQYSGEIVIPETDVNTLEAKYELTSCGASANLSGAERNGSYHGLGYTDLDAGMLTLFSSSKTAATKFSGVDIDLPTPEGPEQISFVGDNLDTNDQVKSTLNPGIFKYEEIVPPEAEDPMPQEDEGEGEGANDSSPETGTALLSSTGRLVILTDRRALYSHVRLSPTLTFNAASDGGNTNPAKPVEVPAARIFGAPESMNSPFSIIGSLLSEEGGLASRYRMTRQDAESTKQLNTDVLEDSYSSQWSLDITTTLTLAADGGFTGSDSTGCAFNGEYFVPDPDINVFEAKFTADECTATEAATGDERNGDFNALGKLNSDGKLVLIMANGAYLNQFIENL